MAKVIKTFPWGQRDSTAERAIALHMTDPDSIPGIPYGPQQEWSLSA